MKNTFPFTSCSISPPELRFRTQSLSFRTPAQPTEVLWQTMPLQAWILKQFPFFARLLVFVVVALFNIKTLSAEERVDYLTQIRPILRERCGSCHGPLKQEGKLRLDTAALAIGGGDSGAAIAPGNELASLLVQRVTATDTAERMPPQHEGEQLTVEQISLLRRWITLGAIAPADEQPEADPNKHWAFQKVLRPEVPESPSQWVRNPIDAFLHQQHQKQGLTPQPEADRIILLRRLHLDLIGIPPTLEEINACEADSSPQWYEQTAMRLLGDQRHGERWARHWMDIWRYSDWWGLGDQLRNSQKHIWHWRDWIVESLNADTPYDEMVRLMLAADELHPNDLGKLRATGYLARNYWLFNRPQWMEETVEHVSKGFLGLTMNCSRCHDHKYDPLEQTDYYRLRAFFEPYHVRIDNVPGEADLARDGIPRVFDGLHDEPTYRYIRGDERNPDKSKIIAPGVPAILNYGELKIETVSLPVEAWQPERRHWVLDSYIAVARNRVTAAELELRKAQEKFSAEKKIKESAKKKQDNQEEHVERPDGTPIVAESFRTLDSTRWKLLGGEWVHEQGRLEQRKDGATRSALRLMDQAPKDFDATVRFTTLGGSQWRSVGLSFDATQKDPTQPAAEADSEINVYVSAVSGGAKVQAALLRDGKWQFPAGNAVRTMPIKLNREYTLRVQVRDSLLNASLDGEPLIAWEIPIPRRDGGLHVFTFDALAAFHAVTLRALDPAVPLHTKDAVLTPNIDAAEMARAELNVAEAALASAHAVRESVERRADAFRAQWNSSHGNQQDMVIAAIRAERLETTAKERHNVAIAEKEFLATAADKKEASEKKLESAREVLVKAIQANDAEIKSTDPFSRFSGAVWTPTRFLNSGKDDPIVEFTSTSTGRRTALANWITDRRNPLAARVAVNHIWTRHMGQSLVPTVFDFGLKGTRPVHPELLDWLASELMDSGWSMRHLHQLIVTSSAYRMSSSTGDLPHSLTAHLPDSTSANLALHQDPENSLWWRRIPIRLESQIVRDALLSMAGTLDPTMGGPSISPEQQSTSTRRSLYFFHSNNDRSLFLSIFDEALVKDCYRREQSIVPQQALALTNSRLALDASDQIAKSLSKIALDDAAFIRLAFRLVVGINAGESESKASQFALEAWRKQPKETQESARSNLVWALINHNDFVTLR